MGLKKLHKDKHVKIANQYLLRYSTTPWGLVSRPTSSFVLSTSKELRNATVSISIEDKLSTSGPLINLGLRD
jgi:hypothetical protein